MTFKVNIPSEREFIPMVFYTIEDLINFVREQNAKVTIDIIGEDLYLDVEDTRY